MQHLFPSFRRLITLLTLLLLCLVGTYWVTPAQALNPRDAIGTIEEPPGTEIYNQQVPGEIALIYFISNMIRVATIAAGLWVLVNVVYAGFVYMTGNGDAQSHAKISQLLSQSFVGLLLITTAYTIAGLVGLLVFGDPTYIISPQF